MEEAGGKEGVLAKGIAADLRLIKVNKPFKSIIKLAFKGRNPRVHKLPRRQRPQGESRAKGEALNGAQPPPSGRHNRSTYFQIKARAPGQRVVHAVILNGESAIASVCFEICYGLPRDASSSSNLVSHERLTGEISSPAKRVDVERSDPFDACPISGPNDEPNK
ncbi:unnamed protein product [Lasius platythorax]|uniref:Uncharacterized protein n=1 Tax=Lasius platythorax TaxID=488582 RepID=A0AAV2NUK9_9HYME